MPMYNLIEYSSIYSETTGRLYNFNNNVANTNNFKSLNYKPKLLENTEAQHAPNAANGILKNTTFAVSLKSSSNFFRYLKCYY